MNKRSHSEDPLPDGMAGDNAGEDESGLEAEQDRGPEIEVPFDPSKIDIIVKPMTISVLKDRLENDELDLTPDFQRQANLWNTSRKARLIESVLLRIPLPSFYFSEDADGSYSVVDGLQRLCAIFHFMSPEQLNRATGAQLTALRLEGLQYLKELEGKSFEDLDRKFQRRISELEITTNIIRANTPSAVKFNVFARLNQGGMPLNAQEIRNAIFPGIWRDRVREIAESTSFLKATEGKIKTERQQDTELVLRFIALWRLGKPFHRPLNQALDGFLNDTVEKELVNWGDEKWKEVAVAFDKSLHLAQSVFGRHVFRKSFGYHNRKPINRGLFEAQLVALNNFDDPSVEKLIKRKEMVEQSFEKALAEDKKFVRSLLYATGASEESNTRIAKLTEIFNGVVNA